MMVFPGFFVATFARWARIAQERPLDVDAPDDDKITVDNHQAEGVFGVHQARIQLKGDPTTYRMIVAPANAPISINGRPADEVFAAPLGDR